MEDLCWRRKLLEAPTLEACKEGSWRRRSWKLAGSWEKARAFNDWIFFFSSMQLIYSLFVKAVSCVISVGERRTERERERAKGRNKDAFQQGTLTRSEKRI